MNNEKENEEEEEIIESNLSSEEEDENNEDNIFNWPVNKKKKSNISNTDFNIINNEEDLKILKKKKGKK